MTDNKELMTLLLISYVSLIAERNAYGPGDGFEYLLYDEINGKNNPLRIVYKEEADEILSLMEETKTWVTFNDDTGMFDAIDLGIWKKKLGNART